MKTNINFGYKPLVVALACGALLCSSAVMAQTKPIKIGIVTFMSGPAAGPFGVPARQGAEVTAAELNAGKVPAPYATKGFGGTPVEFVYIDEAGSTSKQVSEYRNLINQGVDYVIGYTSSGNCLAVAPVAEEMKKVTLFFDCGTPRIFEDSSYKYVFRPVSNATMDSVGAARYVVDLKPNLKTYAGINQNYAWGQDSWSDFENAMHVLAPSAKQVSSQMPKFGAGQYNAEISSLLAAHPEVVFSSFWGGDLESLLVQAGPRDLFKKSLTVLSTGETAAHGKARLPDGVIIGARGLYGVFAPDNALNHWLRDAYTAKYADTPSYPSYKMTQSIFGLKAAYEKAQKANGDKQPTPDQVIAAFEHLSFDSPAGMINMALGKGHQGAQGVAYGMVKNVDGKVTVVNVKHYSAQEVLPPDGVKSADWIKAGMKH
jgi:branched-chain amino acid transport system substrate-binding protein